MNTVYYNNIKHIVNKYSEIKFEELHRDGDLPALVDWSDDKFWYKNGIAHRDNDLPAYIGFQGCEWVYNGKYHREGNYPAIIWNDGIRDWYKNDKWYSRFKFEDLIFLQIYIKMIFHFRFNKNLWSPN